MKYKMSCIGPLVPQRKIFLSQHLIKFIRWPLLHLTNFVNKKSWLKIWWPERPNWKRCAKSLLGKSNSKTRVMIVKLRSLIISKWRSFDWEKRNLIGLAYSKRSPRMGSINRQSTLIVEKKAIILVMIWSHYSQNKVSLTKALFMLIKLLNFLTLCLQSWTWLISSYCIYYELESHPISLDPNWTLGIKIWYFH